MNISIRTDAASVDQYLSLLARRMTDMGPVMETIGEILADSVARNFREGRAPDGTPWRPGKRKGRGDRPVAPTLVDTGRLRDSINYRAYGDRVEAGTDLGYAAVHQFGGRTAAHIIRPRRKKALYWPGAAHPVRSVRHPGSIIPARPFLGVRDSDWPEIRDVLLRYLTQNP
ncbi:MAG: phage virion morphogenesis protein [Thermodesulfobacteriota bacterium]|nr:phage virion morphogenesis protein [Thermodesulfobacteriota bacterium]